MYAFSSDLGQASDYTAHVLVERREDFQRREGKPGSFEYEYGRTKSYSHYDVLDIIRPPLNTPYTEIARDVKRRMEHPLLKGRTTQIVDATGVGRGVVDMMQEIGLMPECIVITGGHTINVQKETGFWNVPKRDLIGALQVVFQSQRLTIADGIDEDMKDALKSELSSFVMKIKNTNTATFEAWRSRQHDDIVLALAMAIWYLETSFGGSYTRMPPKKSDKPKFDPMRSYLRK